MGKCPRTTHTRKCLWHSLTPIGGSHPALLLFTVARVPQALPGMGWQGIFVHGSPPRVRHQPKICHLTWPWKARTVRCPSKANVRLTVDERPAREAALLILDWLHEDVPC